MKKSFKVMLAVAMLFSATLSANAQFSKKESNREPSRFHMGLRAGYTSTSYITEYDLDAKNFVTGGLALDFQVAPIPIFVGMGLNYMNYGVMDSYYSKGTHYYYSELEDGVGIQMPITVSYHINVAPNLFINPFFGGFVAYNNESGFGEDFNYGMRIGAGLNYGRLTFDMGYDLGLANLAGDDWNNDITSGTFFMTIGFNWAGSR